MKQGGMIENSRFQSFRLGNEPEAHAVPKAEFGKGFGLFPHMQSRKLMRSQTPVSLPLS
jgi:hypothetical protein